MTNIIALTCMRFRTDSGHHIALQNQKPALWRAFDILKLHIAPVLIYTVMRDVRSSGRSMRSPGIRYVPALHMPEIARPVVVIGLRV